MGKTLLQRLEKEAENLIHAAGNVPYRVKKATVGTSFREDLSHGRKVFTHHAKQGVKGVSQELEDVFEDVAKNVKHFDREWQKHPERLQNRARRFMSEGVGFLETTAKYLQNEGSKLSKNLKAKIEEAVNVIKHAMQSIMKYFSSLLGKFTHGTPILHAKHTAQAAKKMSTEATHGAKHEIGRERPRHR